MKYNLKPKIKIDSMSINSISIDMFKEGINLIETYPGVRINDLIKLLKQIGYKGKIIQTEDFSNFTKEKFRDFIFEDLTDDRVFGKFSNKEYSDVFNKKKIEEFLKNNNKEDIIIIGLCSYLFGNIDTQLFYVDIPRWELQLRYRKKEPVFFKNGIEEDKLKNFKRGYFIEWRMADRIKEKIWSRINYYIDGSEKNQFKCISKKTLDKILDNASSRPFRLVPYFDAGIWGGQWMSKNFDLGKNEYSRWAWGFDGVPEENSIIFSNKDEEEIEMPAINLVLFESTKLLGKKIIDRFGKEFPIRFDFLDTIGGQNLSLQVHPTNKYINKKFKAKYTQEESYYILDVDQKADPACYLGLKDNVKKEDFIKALKVSQKTQKFDVNSFVNKFPVKKHDHVNHPAGCIHASSKGCMVLEISTTPYIFTFKLWDWGRLDFDGKPRPINIEHGKNVIDESFNTTKCIEECVSPFKELSNIDGVKEEKTGLHDSQFIETRRYTIEANSFAKISVNDSCNMLNLVEGQKATIESEDNSFDPLIVNYAETFIVPESCKKFRIRSLTKDRIIVLQAFVK